MSKKGILSVVLLIVCSSIFYFYYISTVKKVQITAEKIAVQDLHSDILKIIVNSKKPIPGITSDAALKELKKRETTSSKADKKPADIHNLPFSILVYTANSATSVAGIQPKQASKEITRRYLSLDTDDISFTDMLFLYKNGMNREQEAIDKWADNEDDEEMEEFVKKSADTDPIAAFAFGVKQMPKNIEEGKAYLQKFAKSSKPESISSSREKQSYEELMKSIEGLD
jgi:hypothetical protein